MPIKKILITVTTYPLPSRSYDELVCTAGVLEDGSWIRIYPIPLSFLNQVKQDIGFKKYTWIELDVEKRTSSDFRPESYSPNNYNIKILKTIELKDNEKSIKEPVGVSNQSLLDNNSDLKNSTISDSKSEPHLKPKASRFFKKPIS